MPGLLPNATPHSRRIGRRQESEIRFDVSTLKCDLTYRITELYTLLRLGLHHNHLNDPIGCRIYDSHALHSPQFLRVPTRDSARVISVATDGDLNARRPFRRSIDLPSKRYAR